MTQWPRPHPFLRWLNLRWNSLSLRSNSPSLRRFSHGLPLALSLLLCALPCKAASPAEQQVRAQFVYNFANFVEWPESAFADPRAPLKICLFGQVDFAPYLAPYDGVSVGARQLQVVQARTLDEVRAGCHILYLGDDQRVQLPSFWQHIHHMYVLSLGERRAFAEQGGIIMILRSHDRLQFEVNIENALNQGLFLDSDLLSLARAIKRNSAPSTPPP